MDICVNNRCPERKRCFKYITKPKTYMQEYIYPRITVPCDKFHPCRLPYSAREKDEFKNKDVEIYRLHAIDYRNEKLKKRFV